MSECPTSWSSASDDAWSAFRDSVNAGRDAHSAAHENGYHYGQPELDCPLCVTEEVTLPNGRRVVRLELFDRLAWTWADTMEELGFGDVERLLRRSGSGRD